MPEPLRGRRSRLQCPLPARPHDKDVSALHGVRRKTEVFELEQAEEAFSKVMENTVRFRAVLKMG